jgi:hypothetical protein
MWEIQYETYLSTQDSINFICTDEFCMNSFTLTTQINVKEFM